MVNGNYSVVAVVVARLTDNLIIYSLSRKFLTSVRKRFQKENKKEVKSINFHVTAKKCAQFSTCSLIIET